MKNRVETVDEPGKGRELLAVPIEGDCTLLVYYIIRVIYSTNIYFFHLIFLLQTILKEVKVGIL